MHQWISLLKFPLYEGFTPSTKMTLPNLKFQAIQFQTARIISVWLHSPHKGRQENQESSGGPHNRWLFSHMFYEAETVNTLSPHNHKASIKTSVTDTQREHEKRTLHRPLILHRIAPHYSNSRDRFRSFEIELPQDFVILFFFTKWISKYNIFLLYVQYSKFPRESTRSITKKGSLIVLSVDTYVHYGCYDDGALIPPPYDVNTNKKMREYHVASR